MRSIPILLGGAFALAMSAQVAVADAEYTAGQLLSPCQESDNDARWGEAAETECEQYLLGFVGALRETGMIGTNVCTPELNTADEVRWAFMRWVHASYTERRAMTASSAVMATLKEAFPCS